MKCSRPIYALDLGVKENGKRNLKILPRRVDLYSMKQLSERYGKDRIIPLPCGKCLACKLNHAKEWAVRCTLEATLHDENWFVTLTYDDEHLPADGALQRGDIVKFLKRLRARLGSFRYFGCGEYGSKNKRPHYHLILFGLEIPDLRPLSAGLFESKIIREIWPYGFNYIGSVNYSSCNYVARYTTKKCFNDIQDEFIMCSLKPGIGSKWFEENHQRVMNYDCIYGKFGNTEQVMLPRYFEKMAEALDNAKYVELKAKRIDKSTCFQ